MKGKALDWFVSYLADCLQRVAVNGGVSSSTFPLKQGIPQGSYLGPMLFTVYTSTLFAIVEKHLPRVHCYAHDSQLYLSFSPSVPDDDEIALNAMYYCIKDLKEWMIRDKLKLKDEKTEFLLIGTKQQLEKVNFSSITVGDAFMEAKS